MSSERLWHYAVAGQKAGPVAESELLRLRRVGVINERSLIWTEGWVAWQHFGHSFGQTPGESNTSPPPPITIQSPQEEPDNRAVTTLVCGVLGLSGVVCCATLPFSIAAIIVGHVVLARSDLNARSRSLATTGLVMGYVGIAFIVLPVIMGAVWGGWFNDVPNLLKILRRGVTI